MASVRVPFLSGQTTSFMTSFSLRVEDAKHRFVITSGFIGLGLGATPVAIASMDAVSKRHGPSIKAFLVVPLVGAFFIDLINAAVVGGFQRLPFFQ